MRLDLCVTAIQSSLHRRKLSPPSEIDNVGAIRYACACACINIHTKKQASQWRMPACTWTWNITHILIFLLRSLCFQQSSSVLDRNWSPSYVRRAASSKMLIDTPYERCVFMLMHFALSLEAYCRQGKHAFFELRFLILFFPHYMVSRHKRIAINLLQSLLQSLHVAMNLAIPASECCWFTEKHQDPDYLLSLRVVRPSSLQGAAARVISKWFLCGANQDGRLHWEEHCKEGRGASRCFVVFSSISSSSSSSNNRMGRAEDMRYVVVEVGSASIEPQH